jgi:hypothetical protein
LETAVQINIIRIPDAEKIKRGKIPVLIMYSQCHVNCARQNPKNCLMRIPAALITHVDDCRQATTLPFRNRSPNWLPPNCSSLKCPVLNGAGDDHKNLLPRPERFGPSAQ